MRTRSKINIGNARSLLSSRQRSKMNGVPSPAPNPVVNFRLLEDGDFRITEDDNNRITQ